MPTMFASHNGGVANTAIVKRDAPESEMAAVAGSASHSVPLLSIVGGQLGRVTAAINSVGWNHHQVPRSERVTT